MPRSLRTLRNLRNTRDFRAELLQVAASLANSEDSALIRIEDPAISALTVQEEWDRLMVAIKPAIARRMHMELAEPEPKAAANRGLRRKKQALSSIPIDRPNYRAEVLRQLIGASLANDGMWSFKGLLQTIGASQTPVRQALQALKRAGVLQDWGDGYVDLEPENLSAELLAKLQAAPQTLRFRFERGARPRTPLDLVERALPLLGPDAEGVWATIGLSGAAVAQAEVPDLDLAGVPRLDLVASVPREARDFDGEALRKLDDGLEHEPNVLAPAPVVVTLVRADDCTFRSDPVGTVRCAQHMDVLLALLDQNLRTQAAQYAMAIRE